MKIFRVHSTVIYPEGHPLKEKAKADAGHYWKEREHKVTRWDMLLGADVDSVCGSVREHYRAAGASVETIWSVNHTGDITIMAPIARRAGHLS